MSTPHAVSSSAASTPAFSQERKRFAKRSSPARSTRQMAGLARNECSKASRRVAGGAVAGTTDVDASARGVAVPSCAGGVAAEVGVKEEVFACSGGTTRTASRRNILAPRNSSSPRVAASCMRACATCCARSIPALVARYPGSSHEG
ncbi:hypothetical protein BGW80DRAFT_1286242 [Lactifluus volemus]|nr:hypothetical protein BGW80DRAFT_1286242 [Lactifluus volemus]